MTVGNNTITPRAVGDGVADDAPAFQVACDAAAAADQGRSESLQVVLPAGNYLLKSPVTISRNIRISGLGYPNVKIGHTGAGFILKGVPAIGEPQRNKVSIENIRFTTDGSEPDCIIQNGLPDGTQDDPPAVYSQNDTVISNCQFSLITANAIIKNYRGFGLTLYSCVLNSLHVSDAAIRLFQSAGGDIPYWSYAANLHSCDITNIHGVGGCAIKADAGDVFVYGGIIQGCGNDAVWLGASPGYAGMITANFHGTYFEANGGNHVRTDKAASLGFFGGKFTSGGYGSSFKFDAGTKASFYNCHTPNNACSFDGGNVTIHNSAYMVGSKTKATALRIVDHPYLVSNTNQSNLGQQLRVDARGDGGGAAVILCTQYNGGGANHTVAELFLIRFGIAVSQFEAVSISRSAGGTNQTTFSFSVDPDGYLQVAASGTGSARYQVVSHNDGAFLPT